MAAAAIALGLVVMGVFVMRQGRIPNPLLNLEPMCNRLFAPMCALVVVAMMTTFSMSMLLPLYFEGALGTTALAAGALLLAPILVNAVTSLVGGRIMDKRGSWPLLPAGFAVITVGQLAVCLCAPALSLAGVLVASVIVYAGVGLALSPSQTAGLQTLSPEQNPHGVTILNTFIQIAAAVGPSLFIGVLSSVAGLGRGRGHRCRPRPGGGFLGGRCCSVRHRGRGHVDRACLMPTSANVSPRSKRLARRRRKQRAVVALQERRLP